MRILIVDDEPIVRIGIKSMLDWEKHGYEIVGEAENGFQALKMYKKLQPDIILLDIKMPICDGLEVLNNISAILGKKTECIVLSYYSDFYLVKEAMKYGARDYLLKLEMNAEDLLKTVNKVREKIVKERGNSDETQKKVREAITQFMDGVAKVFEKEANEDILDDVFNTYKNNLQKLDENYDSINLIMETTHIISALFLANDINIKAVCKKSYISYKDLISMKTPANLLKWLDFLLADIKAYISANRLPMIVREAKKYVDENYFKEISLSIVAKHVNINEFYLSTLFTKYLCMTFTDYVNKVRLGHAKQLIRSTDKKMHEISRLSGYSNEYYFSKTFKKYIGISPVKYRKAK